MLGQAPSGECAKLTRSTAVVVCQTSPPLPHTMTRLNSIKLSFGVIRNDDMLFNVVVVDVVVTISNSVVILQVKSFCNYESTVRQ